MFNQIISRKAKQWLNEPSCTVRELVDYIKKRNSLREAQIEAIETYLFLKIKGQNKPLWQLLAEGFFTDNEDLSQLNINQTARDIFEQNKTARSLFEVSRTKLNGNSGKTLMPELETYLINNADKVDYEQVIKSIFYGVNYSDYLFSLPIAMFQ
jgi:type III restriction enzyme